MRVLAAALAVALLAGACGDDGPAVDVAPSTAVPSTAVPSVATTSTPWPAPLSDVHQPWTVRVVDRLPHDPAAFTQGLEFGAGGLWESTGEYGRSTLRLTDPVSGTVLEQRELDADHFGEGMTLVDGRPVQLTWRAGVAYRWADDLSTADRIAYEGEGWGLCFDGVALWMSDGTATLTRRSADSFAAESTITVTLDGEPMALLNELECIDGHVVANIWQSDEIVVIDPASGVVRATIDASALRTEIAPTDGRAVLNGIADPHDGTLVLGGKLWPMLFVVEIVEAS